MKFNKYHGLLFFAIREFGHTYHMTGRVSEESPEAYNGRLAETKRPLRGMPATDDRAQLITAQGQANLKGVILDERLIIQEKI